MKATHDAMWLGFHCQQDNIRQSVESSSLFFAFSTNFQKMFNISSKLVYIFAVGKQKMELLRSRTGQNERQKDMKAIFWGLVILMLIAVLFGKSEDFAPLASTLDAADKWLMELLNHNGGRAADAFWWAMSRNTAWITLGAMFLVGVSGKGIREFFVVVLCLALTVTLADQVSSSFLKPFFGRLRPSHCDEISGLLHYVGDYRGGRYGFVSSHAANAFGVATYVISLFRSKRMAVSMLIWACGVSYSRIYLGVHYLGDVLGGAILGVVMGAFCYAILTHVRALFSINDMRTHIRMPLQTLFPRMFAVTVFLTLAVIFCYSYAVTFTPRLLALM